MIKKQGKDFPIDGFQADFYGPAFLAVGPDSNWICSFDLTKPFDFELDPPSSEHPLLCKITQEGKDPILTSDFYITNIEPRLWILPTPPKQKDTPAESGAAAATAETFSPVIKEDPLQLGEIRMHSFMLYTPQAPVLDLCHTRVTSVFDLQTAFHSLYLCPEEDNLHSGQCPNGCQRAK